MIRWLLHRLRHWQACLIPPEPEPVRWVDPTGVLLRHDRYDCIYCGCPGNYCVNQEECPRFLNWSGL